MSLFRATGFSEPVPIVAGTKLELIDPNDVEDEDYGEVLSVTDGVADVQWHHSGQRYRVEVEELVDFVVKDWDRAHWSIAD